MQSGKTISPDNLPNCTFSYPKSTKKHRKAFNEKPSMLVNTRSPRKYSMRRAINPMLGSPPAKRPAKIKQPLLKQSRSDERLQRTGPKENRKKGQSPEIFKSLQKPITPQQTILNFSSFLTKQEKTEIKRYPKVWSIGIDAHKNPKHDDRNGYYHAPLTDHIAYRFDIREKLGDGSFGTVFKVFDHKLGKETALKVIRKTEDMLVVGKHEVKMLQYIKKADLKDESLIIKLQDCFMFRGHLCLSFELIDFNLYEYLRETKLTGIPMKEIRHIACSLLISIQFLHQHNIIHGDLKPENVMLTKDGSIRLIDLGSSCFQQEILSVYIQSRHYRSPEVALGATYDCAVDMWSFGCLLYEMFTGIPLFAVSSTADLIDRFINIIGMPSQEFLGTIDKKTAARHFNSLKCMRDQGSVGVAMMMQGADEELIDLIERCLIWDPAQRITPGYALKHPFIKDK